MGFQSAMVQGPRFKDQLWYFVSSGAQTISEVCRQTAYGRQSAYGRPFSAYAWETIFSPWETIFRTVLTTYLSHSEISDFDLLVGCEKEVAWFDVLVNYTLTVDVLQTFNKLHKVSSTKSDKKLLKLDGLALQN